MGFIFSHNVPELEPPEGTVAVFRKAFASGGGTTTPVLLRTSFGWSESASGRDARTWESLTDLDIINANAREQGLDSSLEVGAVRVQIIAHPGNYRQRYVELESAVYAAAERLGIQTRVFRTGIGTQDIHPTALIRQMEEELKAARAAAATKP